MGDLRLPNPLTAAAVEGLLGIPPAATTLRLSKTLRSGPAADARLLAYLERQRQDAKPLTAQLAYMLTRHPDAAHGWRQVMETATIHLLANYAEALTDYDGVDVSDVVQFRQSKHLGVSGLITTRGGQTSILDRNDVLATGLSGTLFAATSLAQVAAGLRGHAEKRGGAGGSPLSPRLVTYVAEAIENVREHATVDRTGQRDGLCLLQLKRINANQFPSIEAQLADTSPFRAYLRGLARRYRGKVTGLLEVTIADTGPGIARTLKGSPLAREADELDSLLHAFQPGVSSKPGQGTGLGLSNMLEDLHAEHGALQVRSGRFSIFHATIGQKGQDLEDRSSRPDYWTVGRLPDAPGTGITLLVPTT